MSEHEVCINYNVYIHYNTGTKALCFLFTFFERFRRELFLVNSLAVGLSAGFVSSKSFTILVTLRKLSSNLEGNFSLRKADSTCTVVCVCVRVGVCSEYSCVKGYHWYVYLKGGGIRKV